MTISQLDTHRLALAACRLCGHHNPAVRPILSLARAPKVMLVGQAPGKTEVESQRPFAGRAGKTLFQWLERAGIAEQEARAHIYIGAITRCYPGSSPSGRGDRVPTSREQELCRRWLDAELQMIRPRVIIPVGRLSIDHFLDPQPLADVVGREHHIAHAGGQSIVIPLPHPSGASSWIYMPGHTALLDRALSILRTHLGDLGISR